MLTQADFLDAITNTFQTVDDRHLDYGKVMAHPRFAGKIMRWNAFHTLNRIRPLSEASLDKIKVPKGLFRG